jgi:hypothetical protein
LFPTLSSILLLLGKVVKVRMGDTSAVMTKTNKQNYQYYRGPGWPDWANVR